MNFTLAAVVVVALFFDFTNGFHDTANSIATSVSTRALSPRVAVADGRRTQLRRRLRLGQGRGNVAKGIVDPDAITLNMLLAGLVGAITWNLITWYLGTPVELESRTHRRVMGASVIGEWLERRPVVRASSTRS